MPTRPACTLTTWHHPGGKLKIEIDDVDEGNVHFSTMQKIIQGQKKQADKIGKKTIMILMALMMRSMRMKTNHNQHSEQDKSKSTDHHTVRAKQDCTCAYKVDRLNGKTGRHFYIYCDITSYNKFHRLCYQIYGGTYWLTDFHSVSDSQVGNCEKYEWLDLQPSHTSWTFI